MAADSLRNFARRQLRGEFQLAELVVFLAAVRDAGIETLPIDQFAERFAHYDGRRRRQPDARYGLFKFDLHYNIERALRIGEAMHGLGQHGLFLMMHPNPLNKSIYKKRATWDVLARLRALGHEIGLHLDPFHLIRTYKNLYDGIAAAVADFKKRGFPVRAATLHGHSVAHIKSTRLQANDFFSEGLRRTRWSGQAPKGEEYLVGHMGRYSQVKIARDFGIHYFVETYLAQDGKRVNAKLPVYLSDNRSTFHINRLPSKRWARGELDSTEAFRLEPEFAREAAAAIATRPFIALLHPQWYG